jgi:uncharacterized protein YdeI (YjbR/CyaY-like superfamily)
VELPELLVADAGHWRQWLVDNHATSSGVVVVLAKKGVVAPTSLSYAEALEEALCFGWIDGRIEVRDDNTFRRRFTPRGPRSRWSQRNTSIAERLLVEQKMHPSGLDAVLQAKADGRWAAAYAGQASSSVPDDLMAALRASPRAWEMFHSLTSANRYAILYRIDSVKRADTRRRRIERYVEMLVRGETIHPQTRKPAR